jgi:hypothetical protein
LQSGDARKAKTERNSVFGCGIHRIVNATSGVFDLVDEKTFWSNDPDELLRCFIIEHMANANIDSPTLVRNLDAVFQWLKARRVPPESGKPSHQKLKAVT